MTYWVLQGLAAVALFSLQFMSGLEHTFAIYPDWVVLSQITFNSLLFIVLSHFIIRAPQKHFLPENALKSTITKTLFISIIFATILDITFSNTFQLLLNSDLNAVTRFFRGGVEHRLELQAYDLYQAKWETSKLLFKFIAITFLYLFWAVAYLALTGVRNRLAIKQKVQEGQLALLMSQLNPHFLFNSMNSIRGMIFENKEIAKELVDKLTELFRYNLSSKQKPTVSLKDELAVCEFYLDIEHTRLEERLLIEINIPDECLELPIPTMGLLTLLENAIKHGIAPRIEPSLLKIDAFLFEHNWQLTVSNPIYHGSYKPSGTGTGLTNLKQRMALMFKDDATVTTEHIDDQFIARITLPMKKK